MSTPVARLALTLVIAVSPLCAQASPTVVPWQPANISSEWFESHGAFDPSTGDFYFVRSKRDFSGWRIMVSHCEKSGWSTPLDADFAGDGVEADPFFPSMGACSTSCPTVRAMATSARTWTSGWWNAMRKEIGKRRSACRSR